MVTTTTEALSEVLRGYGRADEAALASLLERRATRIVQSLDDGTLEAIASGSLDVRAVCRQVADEIKQTA